MTRGNWAYSEVIGNQQQGPVAFSLLGGAAVGEKSCRVSVRATRKPPRQRFVDSMQATIRVAVAGKCHMFLRSHGLGTTLHVLMLEYLLHIGAPASVGPHRFGSFQSSLNK